MTLLAEYRYDPWVLLGRAREGLVVAGAVVTPAPWEWVTPTEAYEAAEAELDRLETLSQLLDEINRPVWPIAKPCPPKPDVDVARYLIATSHARRPRSSGRCLQCGTPFEVKHRDQLYCRMSCADRYRNRRPSPSLSTGTLETIASMESTTESYAEQLAVAL